MIRNLINYPNPFTNETKIILEHNRPDNELDIIIKIYNIDGRIIKIHQNKDHVPMVIHSTCNLEWK